jgi:hypothetical protein
MIFLLLLGQRMVMENFGKKTRHFECSRVPEFLPFFVIPYAPPFEVELPPISYLSTYEGYLWLLQPFSGNKPARGNEGNNRLEMKESGLTQFIVWSPSAVGSKRKWHAAYYYYFGPKGRILIPCG